MNGLVKSTLGPTFDPPDVIGKQVPKLEPQFRFDWDANDRDLCAGLENRPGPDENFEHPHELPETDEELKKLPPGDQAAFKKLKLAFDFLVCRTSMLMGALNDAVQANDSTAYTKARGDYKAFINGLDGYGKHLKDSSIEALIGPDPANATRNIIIGAVIKVTWNPHVSSSGIPIAH